MHNVVSNRCNELVRGPRILLHPCLCGEEGEEQSRLPLSGRQSEGAVTGAHRSHHQAVHHLPVNTQTDTHIQYSALCVIL